MGNIAKGIIYTVAFILFLVVMSNVFQWFKRPELEISIPDTWTKPMTESGYKPANPEKPEHEPGGKIEFIESTGSTPVLYAEGITEDSTTIEIAGAISPDGVRWFQAWVNGRRAELSMLNWFEPKIEIKRSDWSVIPIETVWTDGGVDIGIGAAWQPIAFRGVRAGVSLTTDVNPDITTAPDWIALNGCLSARIKGHVEIGGNIGIQFGDEVKKHTGLFLGVRF